MKCERCGFMDRRNAEFRVRTDVIDLKICRKCAIAARALGLAVDPLTKSHGLRTAVQEKVMDPEFLSETGDQEILTP